MFERARQPAFYDHCQQVFSRHGFAAPKLREPADHHVLLAEVASGRGMALLPRSFTALRRPGVVYRALAEGEALAVGIGLATRRAGSRCAMLIAAAGVGPAPHQLAPPPPAAAKTQRGGPDAAAKRR